MAHNLVWCVCVLVCVHVCTPAVHQPLPLTIMVTAPLKIVEIISGLSQLNCKWYGVKFYSSISLYCRWFEDVSLCREIEKEFTIFPNSQT